MALTLHIKNYNSDLIGRRQNLGFDTNDEVTPHRVALEIGGFFGRHA